MGPLARNVISRTTMIVLAAALLWGAFGCGRAAWKIAKDERETRSRLPANFRRHGGGWVLPGALSVMLGVVGGFFLFAGVVPTSLLYRLRPRAPRLHENPDPGPISYF